MLCKEYTAVYTSAEDGRVFDYGFIPSNDFSGKYYDEFSRDEDISELDDYSIIGDKLFLHNPVIPQTFTIVGDYLINMECISIEEVPSSNKFDAIFHWSNDNELYWEFKSNGKAMHHTSSFQSEFTNYYRIDQFILIEDNNSIKFILFIYENHISDSVYCNEKVLSHIDSILDSYKNPISVKNNSSNKEKLIQIKFETLINLYSLMDDYNKGVKSLDPDVSNVISFTDTVKYYLCYLASADDIISQSEVDFINEFFDLQWDISFLKRAIEVIDMPRFRERIPSSFMFLVDDDIAHPSSDDPNGSTMFIQLLDELGTEFISCDHDISNKEIQAMTDYILMLKAYVKSRIEPSSHNSQGNNGESFRFDGESTTNSDVSTSNTDVFDELDSLVGLQAVKEEVSSLINLIKIRKIRAEKGIKQPDLSMHLVFSGNPGTGKTTVARILSEIYHELGILSKGHLVEVDRAGLVAGYVGQTAIKTQEKIAEAKGGILFIDEAYTLVKDGQDYGQEAIDTILKAMEDYRDDLIIIVAGYTDLMENFLNSNPGLRSRFNKFIEFSDYNSTELYEIMDSLCAQNGFILDEGCKNYLKNLFIELYDSRDKNFGNGRTVRNIFEKAITNQANRIASQISSLSDDELMTLIRDDFEV